MNNLPNTMARGPMQPHRLNAGPLATVRYSLRQCGLTIGPQAECGPRTESLRPVRFLSIDLMLFVCYSQGRNNQWANRANARGLALEYQNTYLLFFNAFRPFTTRQNCRAFCLVRLTYRLRKLTTLAFIVFEWLKRIEANSTMLHDSRLRSKSASMGVRRSFSRVGNVENLIIIFRLLTVQCECMFTKRSNLSTPLVYAGWTSILNLLY